MKRKFLNTTCIDSDEDSGGSSDSDIDDGVANITANMAFYIFIVVSDDDSVSEVEDLGEDNLQKALWWFMW